MNNSRNSKAETLLGLELKRRPRRLRQSAAIRGLVSETEVVPAQLIQPLFVIDHGSEPEAIDSLPGQYRWPLPKLLEHCETILKSGLKAVALFPKLDPALKTGDAREALNPDTLVLRAVREVKSRFPELAVITDIALDPYTSHGHDGLLNATGDVVLNDETVGVLAEMAVLNAAAGADFVAPSDMMDGRVGAIRSALDVDGYSNTAIMAYSAKFSSAYYGPFRDAVGSGQSAGTRLLNKDTYQLQPGNRREAMTEVLLDEAEGADVVMVKPAGPYLDIIREVREVTRLPVAAYQVSGEYAQLHAAARLGWLDLRLCRDEALLAIRRAGADMILTYFALEVAQEG